jgi:hypothetical protein
MKGFTLLFASIIVAIVLSVALAISSLTLGQLVLSSAGKDSQFAFYNADTAVECASYYERNSSDSNVTFAKNASQTSKSITCGGITATVGSKATVGATTTTLYYFNISGAPGSSCTPSNPLTFKLEVDKSPAPEVSDTASNVLIRGYGYNNCDTSNPKRVERGLYARLID